MICPSSTTGARERMGCPGARPGSVHWAATDLPSGPYTTAVSASCSSVKRCRKAALAPPPARIRRTSGWAARSAVCAFTSSCISRCSSSATFTKRSMVWSTGLVNQRFTLWLKT